MQRFLQQTQIRITVVLLTVWGFIPASNFALPAKSQVKPSATKRTPTQIQSRAVYEGPRTRSIRIRKEVEKSKVDGLVVGVYQVQGIYENNPRLVLPTDIFKDHDHLRISIESNFDGYVYLVNIDSNGNKILSFPSLEARDNNNHVTAGEKIWMPPKDPLTFGGTKGIEILRVIVSQTRIPFYEGYQAWEDGKIPDTETENGNHKDSRTRGVVIKDKVNIPQPMKGKILARKIELAPPDKNNKEAVIAIPKDKNSDGKMNDQPVVFEIHLQHK